MPPPQRQLPPPNPVTMAAHHRQVFWQIYLPLSVIVVLVLCAGIGVLVAGFFGSGDLARWGDISLIWLISPMLVLTFISFLALAAMGYLLWRILRVLPSYARQAQDLFRLVEKRVRSGSDVAAEPFIRAHSFMAVLRRPFRR